MDNRLEEIRKRDAQEIEAVDMWIHHYTACADRRWLLGKVDAQREELGRLIREQAVLKDEDNRLLGQVDRLVEEIETLKQWIKDAKCALNGER